MAFTVYDPHGGHESFEDPACTYRFNEHGHLIVREGDRRRRIYSPSAWAYVEDKPPAAAPPLQRT